MKYLLLLFITLNVFALNITCEKDPVIISKDTACLYSSPELESKQEYVCGCDDIPFGFTNDRTTKDVLVTTKYYHYDTKRCYGSDTFKTIDEYTVVSYNCPVSCNIEIPNNYLLTGNECGTPLTSEFTGSEICACQDDNGYIPQYAQKDSIYTSKPSTPDDCRSEVGSYVIPKTRSFHEDIAIAGSDLTLHYSSSSTKGFRGVDFNHSGLLAQGWDISVHHRLIANSLYKGDGSVLQNVNTSNSIIKNNALHYHFDANNLHVKTVNALTNRAIYTFTYNGAGKLTKVTDSYGNQLRLEYNSRGVVEKLKTHSYVETVLNISNNLLQSVSYEGGATYEFAYDSGALMLQETEPNGNIFKHLFDSSGRVTQVDDAQGGIFAYETSNSLHYDESIIHYPENEKVTYRNYAPNNGFSRSTVTLASGDVITTKVSEDKRTIIKEECGTTTTKEYRQTHPTTSEPLLTKLTISTPKGNISTTTIDTVIDGKREDKTITHNGKKSYYTVDYKYGDVSITTAEGRKAYYFYDPTMTRLLRSVIEGRYRTTYMYAEGRLISIFDGNNIFEEVRRTELGYDGGGNLEFIRDPMGRETHYRYGARGLLYEITKPNGDTVSFAYDANGNMTQLHTPSTASSYGNSGGNEFTYNGVNKKTSWQSQQGYETKYFYDKQRRLTQIVRPSGKTENFTYTNGLLTEIQTDETTLALTYGCDDKLESITASNDETLTYSYDGHLLTRIRYSGMINNDIDFFYDDNFRPIRIRYAGHVELLEYNADGLLTRNTEARIQYNPSGLPKQITSNAYKSTLKHNMYGERNSNVGVVNKKHIFSYDITKRDNVGRILSKTEHLNGKKTKYNYTYDKLGRLIKSESIAGNIILIPAFDGLVIPVLANKNTIIENYTYDNEGNRVEQSITKNGTVINKTASYTIDNALESIGDTFYTYDDDGYLTSKTDGSQTTTYEYGTNGELRAVTLTDGTSIEYIHNANNQRVAKLVNGEVVEKYLWKDLTTLLAVYYGNGTLKARFSYAGSRMPYKMLYNSDKSSTLPSTYYLLYNHLGSLRAVTDNQGNILKELTYDSFGNVVKDITYDGSGNIITGNNPYFPNLHVNLGFAGGLYDKDTKLTRFGYRDYDAEIGRWTAKDPIGFAGGDTNLYGYVVNDPVNFVDPLGLFFDDANASFDAATDYLFNPFGAATGALKAGVGLANNPNENAAANAAKKLGNELENNLYKNCIKSELPKKMCTDMYLDQDEKKKPCP